MTRRSLLYLLATPWLFTALSILMLWTLATSGSVKSPDPAVLPWAIGMILIAVVSLGIAASVDVAGPSRVALVSAVIANLAIATFASLFIGFIAAVGIFGMP